jgi:hypothetical protein
MALSTTVVDTALLKKLIGGRKFRDIFPNDRYITRKSLRQWRRGDYQPDAMHFMTVYISVGNHIEGYPDQIFLDTESPEYYDKFKTFIVELASKRSPKVVAQAVGANLGSVYRWRNGALPDATHVLRLIECYRQWMQEDDEASPEALFYSYIRRRCQYRSFRGVLLYLCRELALA